MSNTSRAYFCLNCQGPVEMRAVQAGQHLGHLMTEFQCATEEKDDGIIAMMRMFREKLDARKRYRHLSRGAGL